MRRVRLTLSVVALLFVLLPTASAGEPDGAAPGLSDVALVELALSDMREERALAAQALRQAEAERLERVFGLLRERMGLVKKEKGDIALLDLAKERMAAGKDAKEKQVPLITAEVRVLQLPAARREALLSELGWKPGDVLDDAAADTILRALQKSEDVQVITAPRLSLLDGDAASLAVTNQIAYVSGFRVEHRGDQEIADPQVGVLTDGMVMRIQGRTAEGGKSVVLSLRTTWADVVRPVPVFEGRLLEHAAPVSIQHPITRFAHAASSIRIPSGGAALLAGPRRGEGMAILLLVRADVQQKIVPGTRKDHAAQAPPLPAPQPAQGAHDGKLVQADVKILDIAVEAVGGVLGDTRPAAQHQAVLLDAKGATALLARVAACEDANVISSPSITVFDGQRANVSILNQVSYIQDYEIEVTNAGKVLGDPIIQVIQEGIVLELTPKVQESGETVCTEFEATFASIKRPIAEQTVKIEEVGKSVTIQLPEVEVARTKATVAVPDGGYVLMGGVQEFHPDAEHRVLRMVLVNVRTLSPDGIEDPKKDR